MSQQASLQKFAKKYEWATETFVKTVIFDLQPLTNRKRERVEKAIESAESVQAEAARRLPGVPPERWGTAQPANSVWYAWAKTMDSHLSNKDVHENIQRVREAFRSWQSSGYDGDKPAVERFVEGGRCAFYYAKPTYTVHDGTYYISVPLAAGRGERELLPIKHSEYLHEYADRIDDGDLSKGRAEIVSGDSDGYRFHQAVRREVDVIANPQTMIGVDIGLTNLAAIGAVKNGEKRGAKLWSGAKAAEMRGRFESRKRTAQSDAEYERIRDDESRYIEHVCHEISREIIEWALEYDRPKIVLEDLTDIRDTFIRREREHTSDERRALHSWPFRKLQDMIEYKALEAGVPTEQINPEYTSQACNECGARSDDNRDGVYFECSNCGYAANADVNAAFNIADPE